MVNPDKVGLIVFDMDGTIIPSLPAVYESIKRAFQKLGWTVNFGPDEINQFFGVTTASTKGSLYEFITPSDSHLSVDEVRELVRAEYEGAFRDMARPYPDVKETLATLRQRGYKLVQYTNATTMYLNVVMSTLQLRDSFDHIECIQDNNLTKPQLVRKFQEMFGGLTTAVVGDRSHDIEAAREISALSIGALYGYGGDEPKAADLTIASFKDLLDIFDRRLPVFRKIEREIRKRKVEERAFVVGVSGIDGSGKTMFAGSLEKYLVSRNFKAQAIHLDDFHNPKVIRHAGPDPAENYYQRSFNLETIASRLLQPMGRKKAFTVKIPVFNYITDRYEVEKEYYFNADTIIIFEGVFLFRQELAPYIDFKVFLDIPFEESKRRALVRDQAAVIEKYDVKYLPAQAKYLKEYPPRRTAHLIIDNTNWEYPKIAFAARKTTYE
jgi:HAD superfamily hydrolase (TIGR01549 family)